MSVATWNETTLLTECTNQTGTGLGFFIQPAVSANQWEKVSIWLWMLIRKAALMIFFLFFFFKGKSDFSNSLLFLFPHRLVGTDERAEEMTTGEVK